MDNKYSLVLMAVLAAIFLHESLAGYDTPDCPWIDLENGRVKIRSRGRVAKFKCKKGFTRFEGDHFATCVRREWNGKIPKCIRFGCVDLAAPENGQLDYLYRKALALFSCHPGYHLVGSAALTCDAINWNHTAPTCAAPATPPMACDFENEDLCGWSNEVHDDFDWVRKRGPSASFMAGTGPSADHTLGTNAGHYMYVDASIPREEGHRALLFSPVYSPAVLSGVSCFSFYFHKYGRNSGALNAYVKPEGVSLDYLPPFLQMSDTNEARWFFHKINLTNTRYNFQIVLEAVRDVTNSDMAVDDVKLAHGDDCSDHNTMPEVRPEVTSPPVAVSPTADHLDNTTTALPATSTVVLPATSTAAHTTTNTTIYVTFSSKTQPDVTIDAHSTSSNIVTEPTSSSDAQSNATTTDIMISTNDSMDSTNDSMESTNDSMDSSPSTTAATISRPHDTTDATNAPETTSIAKPAQVIDTNVTTTILSPPDNTTTAAGVATQLPTSEKEESHTTPVGGAGPGEDLQSCRGRCGEIAMDEEACGCDIECGNDSTCCVDLATFCPHYLSTPKTVSVSLTAAPSASTMLTSPSVSPVSSSVTNLSETDTTEDGELPSTKLTTSVSIPTRPVTHTIEMATSPAPVTIKFLTEALEKTLQERTLKPTTPTENKGKLTTNNAEGSNRTTRTALPTTTETSNSWILSGSNATTFQPIPTNSTSQNTASVLVDDNENKTADDSRLMSKSTATLITILVITGVLLVAVVVFVYVRKIRNQDKLPDDSDIRFLARDEVQMVDNITHLYGERPRRGTPV